MKIVAAFKIVPDDQDIRADSGGSLDYSRARGVISTYDLNALEAAVRIAQADGSLVTGISVGPSSIDDSKLKKNVLAHGVGDLLMVADDAYANLDAYATAEALAQVLTHVENYDLVFCGSGSADNYAQQVDVQLAARLGIASVKGVTKIISTEGSLVVERTLEQLVETVRVPLPAVLAVSPEIAVPRIPGMKDILAAGKKPSTMLPAISALEASLETLSSCVPQQATRKRCIFDAAQEGSIEKLAEAIQVARLGFLPYATNEKGDSIL